MAKNIDDAIDQMHLEDLEGATKMSPIDYAKSRGMYPQKVYKALRENRLQWSRCECGRRVIVIDEADKLFKVGVYGEGASQAEATEEEVPGSDVDAG